MIDLTNKTDLPVDIDSLEKIVEDLTQHKVELIITDNEEIKVLNMVHRNKSEPTDVLSFPIKSDVRHVPLGSIVISREYVVKNANFYGHSEQEELTLLFMHGLLHLIGYDHEVDAGEMRHKEEALIDTWKLPKSLIVRNQEKQL
ncbi:MAG: rRNA maturation RNase YbeY [Sulfurovum sp.]|nr:rRNA maturation RNase YbeY [Sulfurovum sp.]